MSETFTSPDTNLDPTRVIDRLAAAGFEIGPPLPLVRTLLDTFDGRLHAADLRLELRRAPEPELVLTGSTGTPPAHLTVAGPPHLADDLPPGPFRGRVAAVSLERALLPVVTVASTCRIAQRRDGRGKVIATVAVHDHIDVAGAVSVTGLPVWLAEVTGTVGHDDMAERTIEVVRSLGLVHAKHDLIGFAARAANVDLRGRTSSPTVAMESDEPAFDAYRRVLANLADTVAINRDGTIDDIDPEFLHELRVAVRRTRSVLAQSKTVLPDEVRDTYREVFGWIGTATSPARDLDVYVLEWDTYIAPLPAAAQSALGAVLTQLETRRLAAHVTLAEVLRSDRFRSAMADWQRWLSEPATGGPKANAPIGPFVAKRIAKAQATLLEDGRAITAESPGERLHDLRKDAKKLRYLLECFGSLLDTKPRKAFVKRLKALQDNLGAHQDAEVHVAELRELAFDLHQRGALDAGALLAMGQLTAHLEQRRIEQRHEFFSQFTAYDTKQTAEVLDELLRGARETA